MSDTSRSQLYFAKESTYGVAPTGAFTALRFTGESLQHNQDTIESAEIRADRQVSDVVRNSISATGDINFELSYGTFDEFLAAALGSAWQTGVPSAGTDRLTSGTTESSYTFEKFFSDINEYVIYTGMQVSALSLKIVPGAIVTGTMSFLGKRGTAQGTRQSASYVAAPTNPVVNAIDHISAITEGGVAFTGSPLEINLNINANLRGKPAIGVLGNSDIGMGRLMITGSFKYYYDNRTVYNKFLNDTASSLTFKIIDQPGNEYFINLPRIKYTSGGPVSPGIDQDVMPDLAFTAYLDPATSASIRIERNPA
jgi:Phage tail tube protein